MKHLLCSFILLTAACVGNAQDMIYTKREGTIPAKVIELTNSLIRFKKFENIDGPNYKIATRYVDSIVYKNGTKDLFSFRGKKLSSKIINERAAFSNLPDNLFSTGFELSTYNPGSAFWSDNEGRTPYATWFVSYERLFVKQKIGVAVTPFAAWNRQYYGVAATSKFYAKSKGRVRFGIGPMLSYSVQNRKFYYYSPNDNNFGGSSLRMNTKVHVTALALNTSWLVQLNKKLFLNTDLFFGPALKEKPFKNNLPDNWRTNIRNNKDPMLGFRIGLGYRF